MLHSGFFYPFTLVCSLVPSKPKEPGANGTNANEGGPLGTGTIAGIVALFVILASGSIVAFLLVTRRMKKSNDLAAENEAVVPEAHDEGSYLYMNTDTEAALPTHISLQKDANLKEKSTNMAEEVQNLEEFKSLVDYVKENMKKEMTIRNEEKNKEHNRYIDIGKIS